MNSIKTVSALGIMSSTSYEGIGLAQIVTDGIDIKSFGPAYITPFDEELLEKIRKIDGHKAVARYDPSLAPRR